jgi:hypothetical protein
MAPTLQAVEHPGVVFILCFGRDGSGRGETLDVVFSIAITVIFPFLLIVIGMAHNVPDEYFLAPIIHPGYQPAFVVADIKNNASPDIVRVPPTLFDIREVCPIRVLGNPVPGRQGGLPFWNGSEDRPPGRFAFYAQLITSNLAPSCVPKLPRFVFGLR